MVIRTGRTFVIVLTVVGPIQKVNEMLPVKTKSYITWLDLKAAVEALLSERQGREVRIRDYAGRFQGNTGAPYQDFWHWWLDQVDDQVSNGYIGSLYYAEFELDDDTADWVREIWSAIGEVLTEDQHEEVGIEYSW